MKPPPPCSPNDGRIVVYMGDDEAGQCLYRYISRAYFDPAKGSANSTLLDDGTLYVARFDRMA